MTPKYLLRDSKISQIVDFRWFPAIVNNRSSHFSLRQIFISKNVIDRKCIDNRKKTDKIAYRNKDSFVANCLA